MTRIPPPSAQSALAKMLRASEAAWLRQDFQQSLEILERAVKTFPNDPCVLLDLGRAHGMRYDFAAAEQCFEKAIRVSNWKMESYLAAGLHCRSFDHLEMAQRYFERAVKKHPEAIEPLVQLAELYEHRHELDLARDTIDRALRCNASALPAVVAQARLHRQAARLEEAEKLLQTVTGRPHPDYWNHARAWYELGGIRDRQGRFDEAMAAFLEAKKVLIPKAANNIQAQQAFQQRLQATAASVSADDLRRWFVSGQEMPALHRHVLLGGHPRSGTTLLEQVLDAHPDVISAEETLIFHSEAYRPLTRGRAPEAPVVEILNSATNEQLARSRSEYLRVIEKCLGEAVNGRILIDKNPSQTAQIPAVVRILPQTKFLIALRDPRDVCLSCFMQPLPLNPVASAYLTIEGAAREFASLMAFWKNLAPKLSNPWIEVRYEEVVSDLESAARRVSDFLGIPWDPRVLAFNEHARNKIVRSPTYADVVKPVFKGAVGRWKNYSKHLEPALPILAPMIKALGYD